MKNIDAGTLTRIIVLVLALINQALALSGFNPIPVDEDALYQFISMAFMGVASIWAWWKNNPVTKEAKWGQEKTNKYKAQKKMAKATGYAPVTEEPVDGLQNK
ncbi:phage holin [Mammaliicoccus sciuri]|uniref:phage holin n=1 Tax=Mammaliicoccus sciuri TaxID=1296 RepID=UPI002B2601F7|nr:phage holin [Mammaliicoccus sciuri]WQJ72664.1 phage holin [Mammaliicoccus sciuri]